MTKLSRAAQPVDSQTPIDGAPVTIPPADVQVSPDEFNESPTANGQQPSTDGESAFAPDEEEVEALQAKARFFTAAGDDDDESDEDEASHERTEIEVDRPAYTDFVTFLYPPYKAALCRPDGKKFYSIDPPFIPALQKAGSSRAQARAALGREFPRSTLSICGVGS